MTSIAEFVAEYCKDTGITPEAFQESRIVLPCLCECQEGPHWAAIRRDDTAILDHLTFHCPPAEDLMAMFHESMRGA